MDHLIGSCPSVAKEFLAKIASEEDLIAAAPQPLELSEAYIRQQFTSLLQSKERTDVTFEVRGDTLSAHRRKRAPLLVLSFA